MGAATPLKVYGPKPVEEIVERMLRYYRVRHRPEGGGGEAPCGKRISRCPFSNPGDALEVDGIGIRVEKGTNHGNVDDILSYAFEAEGRKIVIASDGSPTEKLALLARGADVLVMHPCLPELIDERLREFQGDGEDRGGPPRHGGGSRKNGRCGRTSGKLVFSHVVPPLAPDDKVREAIAPYFEGEIVAGQDLMRL